jgi:hypothetical protein
MTNPSEVFPESIWRGWLELTGYDEHDMPLAHCHELLSRRDHNLDANSMRDYIIAYQTGWIAGYKEAKGRAT